MSKEMRKRGCWSPKRKWSLYRESASEEMKKRGALVKNESRTMTLFCTSQCHSEVRQRAAHSFPYKEVTIYRSRREESAHIISQSGSSRPPSHPRCQSATFFSFLLHLLLTSHFCFRGGLTALLDSIEKEILIEKESLRGCGCCNYVKLGSNQEAGEVFLRWSQDAGTALYLIESSLFFFFYSVVEENSFYWIRAFWLMTGKREDEIVPQLPFSLPRDRWLLHNYVRGWKKKKNRIYWKKEGTWTHHQYKKKSQRGDGSLILLSSRKRNTLPSLTVSKRWMHTQNRAAGIILEFRETSSSSWAPDSLLYIYSQVDP